MVNLEDSYLHKILLKSYVGFKKQIGSCLSTSFIAEYLIKLGSGLYYLSVKSISIVMLILVISNILLYYMLKCFEDMENGLLGWIIRGVLLFVGFAGIFCKAQLKDLRETSLFLRWIYHSKLSLSEEK